MNPRTSCARRRRAARGAALAAALSVGGCSSAVWSDSKIDAGQAAAIPRAELARSLPDKPAVLACLGPPGEVLTPGRGDVFVYRLLQVDEEIVQLNAALFAGPALPIMADIDRRSRSEVLFVFFDADGKVTQTAHRRLVQGAWGGSSADGLAPRLPPGELARDGTSARAPGDEPSGGAAASASRPAEGAP
ncbi:MAG: hypothetical protein H6825_15215 [Planctomycetes bacterium]|nr:hypothetical protein [Planctomycetota bacterium]